MLTTLLVSAALAAPGAIPVQGELTDAQGIPIDDALPVTFTLYGDDQGTNQLWTSTFTVSFEAGAFTAMLGADDSLNLDLFRDHRDTWLGISVDGGTEMDLVPLANAPYAAFASHSGDAATLGGDLPSVFQRVGDTTDWNDITSVPDYAALGYSAGPGLTELDREFGLDEPYIEDLARSVCYADLAELQTDLDAVYKAKSWVPAWTEVTDVPPSLLDGDQDTTYSAGTGLGQSGTVFSLNDAYVNALAYTVATAPSTVAAIQGSQDPAVFRTQLDVALLAGHPDLADGDQDTTYTAGTGLALTGTQFSVSSTYVQAQAKLAAFDTTAELQAALSGQVVSLAAGTTINGYQLDGVENIRAIVPKGSANTVCPSGTAIHVPLSFRGKTGNQICAADTRGKTTCTAVKYVYVTAGNGWGAYGPSDGACTSAVQAPWPWGLSYTSPDTLDGEWGHPSSWVVCCQ